MKKSHDYDNTFKTLKNKHAKLFISVINEAFNKCYPLDSKVEIVSSEGAFINKIQSTDVNKIEIRQNDFLLRINDDYYLIESQTTDDNTMALRLAGYTFLAARPMIRREYSYRCRTTRCCMSNQQTGHRKQPR